MLTRLIGTLDMKIKIIEEIGVLRERMQLAKEEFIICILNLKSGVRGR